MESELSSTVQCGGEHDKNIIFNSIWVLSLIRQFTGTGFVVPSSQPTRVVSFAWRGSYPCGCEPKRTSWDQARLELQESGVGVVKLTEERLNWRVVSVSCFIFQDGVTNQWNEVSVTVVMGWDEESQLTMMLTSNLKHLDPWAKSPFWKSWNHIVFRATMKFFPMGSNRRTLNLILISVIIYLMHASPLVDAIRWL